MVSNAWIVHLARCKLPFRPDEDVPSQNGTMALEEGDIAMGHDPFLEHGGSGLRPRHVRLPDSLLASIMLELWKYMEIPIRDGH